MRYKSNEHTVLGGFFEPNSNVTIKILDSAGNAVNVSDNVCIESVDEPGLFIWNTNNMQSDAGTYFYVMTDGISKFPGKFVYGGLLDKLTIKEDIIGLSGDVSGELGSIRQVIEDVQLGNWQIKDTQLIMNNVDGSELARFDLYDKNGNSTDSNVFSRVRV